MKRNRRDNVICPPADRLSLRRRQPWRGFTPLEKADRRRSSLTGFTLIEIVISLAILAVGLLALLSLFPVGFDAAKRSANLTEATLLAQHKMEEVKNAGYPAAAASGTFAGTGYKWDVAVSDVEPSGYLQKIVVSVSWKYKNRNYEEKFITYVAKFAP